jgi:hypothetical protein
MFAKSPGDAIPKTRKEIGVKKTMSTIFFTNRKSLIAEYLPKGQKYNQDYFSSDVRPELKRENMRYSRRKQGSTFYLYNEPSKIVTSRKVVTPIGNDSYTVWFSKSRIARSGMPPKTGPIPRELLESALYSSGMTAQDSCALLRSCEWQALTLRNSQVVFHSEFAETDTAPRLTTDDIAMVFNISADNVRQIRHRARMKKKEPHGPLALDPDQEADIVRFSRSDLDRKIMRPKEIC